ncbi:hypothetical protein TGPRC2_226985 [Toxoplasma gondii TgCatPRC2]|uniref:Uncharacterized protein n=13 Tax=Toxoplasma gondii TaxID=5811 RepID=A0A125YYP3_TOXGV|nr:hypothetical protein TGME49_226985 [Toxoplasma gondii ME49]EPR62325.1 hypothetical protein TGGT1_226985 [Toxoplasma gondii GT1]ESS32677.1 hypothetical protein TGVEG_226985 [Toxoplasma gondii VEG]KAF4640733.1 hypothetical protein TGRH88_046590 [Toxoplasma gondii]KFG42430.1 hypothetical protein TGP89_226985 [Toxoplasma gondii p89]KFG45220.1 hypothetical protein TGDOM2_226985 [Toxoplasma gondii GAB2-2007-GAL-DOM2]KFG51939.1 hypothetical protein TGFOU_226985 [Toxoplasma gondii FOU]KFG60973.1 |eukprot:XP_018636052.1 hypothetical protein TGME49_226985 [Toxoplasma gondii ME49]
MYTSLCASSALAIFSRLSPFRSSCASLLSRHSAGLRCTDLRGDERLSVDSLHSPGSAGTSMQGRTDSAPSSLDVTKGSSHLPRRGALELRENAPRVHVLDGGNVETSCNYRSLHTCQLVASLLPIHIVFT